MVTAEDVRKANTGLAANSCLYGADGMPIFAGMVGYELSDWTDEMVNPQYHGFLRADGAWAIKEVNAGGDPRTVRWYKGDSGYVVAWAGRAMLVYDYFDTIF